MFRKNHFSKLISLSTWCNVDFELFASTDIAHNTGGGGRGFSHQICTIFPNIFVQDCSQSNVSNFQTKIEIIAFSGWHCRKRFLNCGNIFDLLPYFQDLEAATGNVLWKRCSKTFAKFKEIASMPESLLFKESGRGFFLGILWHF